ncbi:MAG: hypothetical protein LQ339_006156 [Xanthoria mediterranea]|nr:MAG: hypothetical protein LQ339_006156 [Xanthoria mediterranea]
MPQIGSRKRPAPGTSPEQPQAQDDPQLSISQMAPNQYPQWNPANQASNQTPYLAPSSDSVPPQYTLTPQQQTNSNQLARRPPGQDTTERTPVINGGSTELWPSFADTAMQQSNEAQWPNSGDDLDQKALLAKMDAQRKRKQIPPFVQKLSSFLDESRNTELIRWSESGDSFVVIDEEEFARTLIPELFKHKNYASFVRQLNMYGFHKKVGLSDNSMRASERKNKSPSEYYNPYFKRGRPNLLWLIHKPNPPSRGGGRGPRAKQDDGNLDEDVEEIYDMDRPNNADQIGMNASSMQQGRQPLMIGNGGNEPQNLSAVHEELQNVRKQQQMIAALLQKTRAEHEQLYGQAASFQKLHDRHESSINAILTFLATVYNRSLEGKNGQSFGGMFGSIAQDTQAQGNVVDVGDLGGQNMVNGQSQGGFRRQPLLLQAPPVNFQRGSVVSPAGTVHSPASQAQNRPPTMNNPESATSPAVRGYFDTLSNRSSQSPKIKAEASNGQPSEADILSMIQSTNANQPYFNGSQMDFPEALSHLQTADGQTPLTPNQRSHALGLMASTAGNPSANNSNNALTSPSPPLPNLAQYQQSQERLDQLSNALKEQGNKVDQLTTQLAPLSPSGSIPGITDGQSQPNFGGDNNLMLDLDQIFNSGDYFNNPETGDFNFDDPNEPVPGFDFEGKNGRDVDGVAGPGEDACSFGFDGANDGGPEEEGSAVETVNSSEATSPANNKAVVEDSTEDGGGGGKTGKRRRKG